ncbi:MAG: hypothetical protein C6I00_03015 [Nitratiruptor sp.]|nr:hypothetical protein [Nitratiruptor sp.]NPA84325.1 hypothetical protein [Campylobacterota bacterium]
MALFYLLVALLLIFGMVGAVVYFFSDMTTRLKYIVLGSLVAGWLLIALYSFYQNQRRLYHERLRYRYTHGHELLCESPLGGWVVVDRKQFDFLPGTMVFVGKEGSAVAGLVVPIDRCKEQEERGD